MIEQTEIDFSNLQHRYLDERFAHIDDRFKSMEQLFSLATASHEKLTSAEKESNLRAIQQAESLAKHNQEVSNEFRGQLKDQANTFLTISAYEGHHEGLVSKIEDVNKQIIAIREFTSRYTGEREQHGKEAANFKWVIVTAILITGLIIAFATYIGDKNSNQSDKTSYQQPMTTTSTTTTGTKTP